MRIESWGEIIISVKIVGARSVSPRIEGKFRIFRKSLRVCLDEVIVNFQGIQNSK